MVSRDVAPGTLEASTCSHLAQLAARRLTGQLVCDGHKVPPNTRQVCLSAGLYQNFFFFFSFCASMNFCIEVISIQFLSWDALPSPLLPLDIFSGCRVLLLENGLLTCKHWFVWCEDPPQKKPTNKQINKEIMSCSLHSAVSAPMSNWGSQVETANRSKPPPPSAALSLSPSLSLSLTRTRTCTHRGVLFVLKC